MQERKVPNFFIIGSHKCGTTSLHNYLSQHPEIYMSPVKEPHYFSCLAPTKKNPYKKRASRLIKQLDKYPKPYSYSYDGYLSLFSKAINEKLIGESSTGYIEYPFIAKEIQKHFPDSKLLLLIRNPADRAYSHFTHNVKVGIENSLNFEKALSKEYYRMKYFYAHHYLYNYFDRGLYYRKLKSYLEYFNKGQIKICIYEDLKRAPNELLKDIFSFLDVRTDFRANTRIKHNVSGVPKNKFIYDTLRSFNNSLPNNIKLLEKAEPFFNKLLLSKVPALKKETRDKLTLKYLDEINKLEDLINLDLSNWKK